MKSTTQPTIADAVQLASTVQGIVANPLTAGVKFFRTLNKDAKALIVALLTLAGLVYTIQYLTNKR
ncbi:hypothetical protein [Hymenobacter sp. BRD67]|uniref:hypothetical protein n=1 Tax=Hymenobacter sp. BRD67 TaxID=2675877 RepID=UPI00156772CF|nr:hypothetical protein [Hymenobacter sp. BRD67]QKG54976.1 hypothetical protein GKZ67_21350 [Hymenobacter sp. BRD67]